MPTRQDGSFWKNARKWRRFQGSAANPRRPIDRACVLIVSDFGPWLATNDYSRVRSAAEWGLTVGLHRKNPELPCRLWVMLKYLADKYDLPSYPKDLKKRAKVNEVMDWLNTQFYRDFGYGLVYPQLFPHHKRRSDGAHAGAVAWGQQGAKNWLRIFNDHWIGPKNQYLCGNEYHNRLFRRRLGIDRRTDRYRLLRPIPTSSGGWKT